jgi:hypothetical protein
MPVADGIYAAMDSVEPTASDSVLDRLRPNSGLDQSPPRDHAMLAIGKRPD